MRGFEFFALAPAGRVLEVAPSLDEDTADRQYWAVIPDDEVITHRLREVFKSSPDAFAPV